jgi:hypothetical protein
MTFVQHQPAQSTAARRHLPAARAARFLLYIGVVASLGGPPLRAQQTARVERPDEPFLGEIGGPRLGQMVQGAAFRAGPVRGNHSQLTLEGWVFKPSLKSASQGGHTLAIASSPAENMRDAPNGRVLAQLVSGFLLDEVERRGNWVKVRRDVWVLTVALRARTAAAPAAAAPPAAPARGRTDAPSTPTPPAAVAPSARASRPPSAGQPSATAPAQTVDPRRAVVRRRMQLYRAPDSTAIGQLEAGTPVRITARAPGWVRVEAQAWVRENEIRPSDAGILTGLSAAELRGAPEEFRGKLLRWTIQFLSLQTADELRPDFTPGQRYILARGPAPEYAFVYVIVPPERLLEVQRLEPLASVSIVARVISGRSTYLANPILELVELP